MRELAILSAETALTRHARQKKTTSVRTELAISTVLTIVAVSLMYVWRLGEYNNIYALLAGLACGLAAVVWTAYCLLGGMVRGAHAKLNHPVSHTKRKSG